VVAVLVRLRLIIAARNRGDGPGATSYYVGTWINGTVFGLIGGIGTAVFVSAPGFGNVLLLGSFVAISMPWLIGPILEPTLADGTVDPRRLEQFPLTATQQVTGLLAGALLTPTAVFTMLFASGTVIGLAQSPVARIGALAAALGYTLMCVSVSRAAQALLAESLRSRRGRDFAALLAALMVLSLYALTIHLRSTIDSINDQLSGPLGQAAAWSPPGAAAQAIIDARDGSWTDFASRMVVLLAMIALAMIAWTWALRRRVRGDSSSLSRGYRHSTTHALPLIPAAFRPLPNTPTTAAIAQQWHYFFFRSPKAIQTLIIPPVMGIMVAHTTFANNGVTAQAAIFAALAVVVGSFNVFGYDGPGMRYLISAGAPLSKVLIGKALAPLSYLLPLLIGYAAVEATLQNRFTELPIAVAAGLTVVLTGIGIGAQSSVLNPSDQSRVGHRQGMFLKVFAWFGSFFMVASIGAGLWIVIGTYFGDIVSTAVLLPAAAALAIISISWAGRRIDRDPFDLLRRLAPAEY
jgi:ABC-2 type transport system permease protein